MGFRALDVPEILQTILLNLSQQDLLISAQRVCWKWHEVVRHSPALQEALFLRPAASHGPLAAELEFNPLLQSRFPGFFDGSQYEKTPTDVLGPWDTAAWVRGWPPATNDSFEDFEVRESEAGKAEARYFGIDFLKPSPRKVQQDLPDQSRSQSLDKETAARLLAYARSGASWRRMVPCQPAPTELQMHRGIRKGSGLFEGELSVMDFGSSDAKSSGRHLTFGLIYDILEAAWCQRRVGSTMILRVDYFGLDYVASSDSNSFRTSLRDAFKQQTIGGPGRILLHLDTVMACGGYHENVHMFMSKTWRRGRFQSAEHAVMNNLVWDERWTFCRNPA